MVLWETNYNYVVFGSASISREISGIIIKLNGYFVTVRI